MTRREKATEIGTRDIKLNNATMKLFLITLRDNKTVKNSCLTECSLQPI